MALRPASAAQQDRADPGDQAISRRSRHPLTAGLGLTGGSVTIITLRLLLLLLAGVPAAVAAWLGLQQAAHQPYFTSVPGPLPLYHLGRLWLQLPGWLLPCLALGVVLALLANQLLLGGALAWLRPKRESSSGSTLRAIAAGGLAHLGRMLRVLAAVVVLDAAGLAGLRALLHQLERSGEAAGWTARALELQLPALFSLAGLLWLGAVGAWGFACRLIVVADQRLLVRSAAPLALRLLRRKPFAMTGFFLLLTVLLQALGGLCLWCWRQAPPATLAGAGGWLGLALLLAVLQALGWHWLLRGGLLVYRDPALTELRAAPDAPWGWGQILEQRPWRR